MAWISLETCEQMHVDTRYPWKPNERHYGDWQGNNKKTYSMRDGKIPLLLKAKEIIDKYKDDEEVLKNGRLLPIYSSQMRNRVLKEIATACGIRKTITFHVARHTFATSITLTNGVLIEIVSKLLDRINFLLLKSVLGWLKRR